MKDRKLATRYARALLSLLTDERRAEATDRFLDALRQAMESSPAIRAILLDPAISRTSRKVLLRDLAERQGMPKEVFYFLATLVDHNRLASLPSIAQVFTEERERWMGIVPAQLTTATPIEPELAERSRQVLERVTGRRVRLALSVDAALLGGAVTRIGSTIYDGSLRTQLGQLRSKLVWE